MQFCRASKPELCWPVIRKRHDGLEKLTLDGIVAGTRSKDKDEIKGRTAGERQYSNNKIGQRHPALNRICQLETKNSHMHSTCICLHRLLIDSRFILRRPYKYMSFRLAEAR